jgi:class 3 adenylate cyclase
MSGAEDLPILPEHPELREIALAGESAGIAIEIWDSRLKAVFFSTENARIMGLTDEEWRGVYGKSVFNRILRPDTDAFQTTEESDLAWQQHNLPILRRYLGPDDPAFDETFGEAGPIAAGVEPAEPAPRAWYDRIQLAPDIRFRRNVLGDSDMIQTRVSDDSGSFIGIVVQYKVAGLPQSLLQRLGRGDPRLFERMERVSEPARRSAAILFADLEASGSLSRRLSSRGYFDLISDLTDLIDSSVVSREGIVGKHAGDGGSALFVTEGFEGSESGAARAAIEAARAIRDGAGSLGPDELPVRINVGLHWGATLMIGQVATTGRLEVTALGDQMNEGARIEAAAKDGSILASKDLIERLDPAAAEATGIDPDAIAYKPLAEIDGAGDKAIRDAGAIAVTPI